MALIGRSPELALIERTVADVAGVVAISGEPGVGKSRLLDEIASAASAAGRTVRRAVGTASARAIGFGAFAHLLPVDSAIGAGGSDPVNLLASLSSIVCGADACVLVVVDDAHHLDELSAALVHHIAQAGSAAMVMGVRSGVPVPDAIQSVRAAADAQLDLQCLSRAETSELVGATLGGAAADAVCERLWKVSRGNPLFAIELVRSGVLTGALHEVGGVWRSDDSIPLPPRMPQLIDDRLARLDGHEVLAARVLAIAEPIGATAAASIVGDEAIDALVAAGLCELQRDGRRHEVRFSHPLYGEVVRATTPPLAAQALRRQLADAVERYGARRRGDDVLVARWRLDGAGTIDPDLFGRAATAALWSRDARTAERLARAAVDAGAGFDTRLLLCLALQAQARFLDVDRELERLTAATDDDDQRAGGDGTGPQPAVAPGRHRCGPDHAAARWAGRDPRGAAPRSDGG